MSQMRRAAMIALVLISAAGATFGQEQDYAVVPLDLSIIPAISLPVGAAEGRQKTVTVVELNIAVGYTDVLQGAGAGIINLVGEDARGGMVGVGNFVGGDLQGAQAGVVNLNRGSVQGVQTGVVNAAMSGVVGVQAGTANLSRGDLEGAQGGVVNAAMGRVDGVQGGVVNFANEIDGAQLGMVNYSGKVRGLQAGLVNIVEDLDGIPLGLVNVILHGGVTRGQAWYDELGMVNATLIHGSPVFYNLYTVGMDQTQSWWTGGLGLGFHMSAGRSFLHMEAHYNALMPVDSPDRGVSLTRIRSYLGYHVTRRVAVIGGGTLNYANSYNGGAVELPQILHEYEFPMSTEKHRLWPGAFVGLQF